MKTQIEQTPENNAFVKGYNEVRARKRGRGLAILLMDEIAATITRNRDGKPYSKESMINYKYGKNAVDRRPASDREYFRPLRGGRSLGLGIRTANQQPYTYETRTTDPLRNAHCRMPFRRLHDGARNRRARMRNVSMLTVSMCRQPFTDHLRQVRNRP